MPRAEKKCKTAWRRKECMDHADCIWKDSKCIDPNAPPKPSKRVTSVKQPKSVSCRSLRKAECAVEKECVWDRGCKPLKAVVGSPILEKEKPQPVVENSLNLASADKRKLKQLRLRMALRKALSPVLKKDAADVPKRLKEYAMVKNYMSSVPPCLTSKPNGKFFLGDRIDLTKRIGSPSVYGIVYLTKGMGFGRLLKVATKCMAVSPDNTKEIQVLNALTDEVKRSGFQHFPLFYFNKKCNVPLCQQQDADCPAEFLKQPYYVVMSELAQGDLKSWLHEDTHKLTEYTSALFQIYMALAKFHSMGLSHNDAHWGNFLYHKVKPGGYWWYKAGSHHFYIKNTGQLWVLWDFGFAKKHSSPTYMCSDFRRITSAFRYDTSAVPGWMPESQTNIKYPEELVNITSHLDAETKGFVGCNIGQSLLDVLGTLPLILGKKDKDIPEIALTYKRPSEPILNDKPFILMA